jgi:microcystin-dependent protein
MSQSGFTPILIYGSGTASNVPSASDLTTNADGVELALNYTDGKLYFKNNSGVVTLLASSASIGSGVTSFNTRTGDVTLESSDVTTALGYTPPTPTGSGASGTWGINITGNAATATTATTAANGNPTGTILMWSTATAPSGYVLCDGSAISRTTYAALFAVIATTFGAGDGSTTFNVPNYQGNVPLGSNPSYALASIGGSADAIVVTHTHTATSTVTDPGHSHTYTYDVHAPVRAGSNGDCPFTPTAENTGTSTTGITVATTNASTGTSGTGANLPPYLAINFIIKT